MLMPSLVGPTTGQVGQLYTGSYSRISHRGCSCLGTRRACKSKDSKTWPWQKSPLFINISFFELQQFVGDVFCSYCMLTT